eukprot:scaffold55067_cov71-Phaeocystis_antarctica.AAC.1
MLDEPNGLGAAPAAAPAPSAAPTVCSNNWLEQQQLAGALEEQLTGVETIEGYDCMLRTYGRFAHSSAYSIEVAVEKAMLEVDSSEAIEEVVEETIAESNAIVEAMEEAIEEHRADTEVIEEALART